MFSNSINMVLGGNIDTSGYIHSVYGNTNSDDYYIVVSVVLTLKKALDTVDHHQLLKKLYVYWVRRKTHKFIDFNMLFIIFNNMRLATLNVVFFKRL